jgi:hypothetical protein
MLGVPKYTVNNELRNNLVLCDIIIQLKEVMKVSSNFPH